jgi:argininosuccinate lyase
VAGCLVSIITLQKGLPLSYNRDLQEDKRLVFEADDVLAGSLEAMIELITHAELLGGPPSVETASLDLAEALVSRGVPFREAHGALGKLVLALEAEGRSLVDATVDDLTEAHPRLIAADLALIDPAASVARRVSPGGGSPDSVRAQVKKLRRRVTEASG